MGAAVISFTSLSAPPIIKALLQLELAKALTTQRPPAAARFLDEPDKIFQLEEHPYGNQEVKRLRLEFCGYKYEEKARGLLSIMQKYLRIGFVVGFY